MKISQNLPQFQHHKTLLVAAGTRYAKLFLAENGELGQVGEVRVSQHEFTDHESKYQQTGRGMTAIMGARNDHLRQDTQKKFGKELIKKVTAIGRGNQITKIIFFIAAEVKKQVIEGLSQEQRQLIAQILVGNFVQQHPFQLLQKLKDAGWESNFPPPTPNREHSARLNLFRRLSNLRPT